MCNAEDLVSWAACLHWIVGQGVRAAHDVGRTWGGKVQSEPPKIAVGVPDTLIIGA